MELLNLQSSLQSEIQAKQAIGEELSKTRSDLIAAQKWVVCRFNMSKNMLIAPKFNQYYQYLYFKYSNHIE